MAGGDCCHPSWQQRLYPIHFGDLPALVPQDVAGNPDLAFQEDTARVATARAAAIEGARETAQELDEELLSVVGVPVDLAVIQRSAIAPAGPAHSQRLS